MKHSARYIFIALLTSLLYFCFTVLLLNATLVIDTLKSNTALQYKLSLLFYILTGVESTLSTLDITLLCITTILVGINIAISAALIKRYKQVGKLTLTTSGTMLGMLSAGCSACGFSVLSLFGLSGLIVLLPFRGEELYIVAITLLSLSLYSNIQTLKNPMSCKK